LTRKAALSRAYFHASIEDFLHLSSDAVIGALTRRSEFAVELSQVGAWRSQVHVLKEALAAFPGRGQVLLEYVLPRIGRRVDVILVMDHLVFVIEFKVGEATFSRHAMDQVWDYALDLKNFHEPSHAVDLVPLLVATDAKTSNADYVPPQHDGVYAPVPIGAGGLQRAIQTYLEQTRGPSVDGLAWAAGRYSPTPTIIEAARALYQKHSVAEISRSDAGATNLLVTSQYVAQVIADAQSRKQKAICLLTGVPGAGKTLVGLDVATRNMDPAGDLYSVFLSGNGPLVAILREALARDHVAREAAAGRRLAKGQARREVEAFIQNVHHFRDEGLSNPAAPVEHVTIFDEAQRAWNRDQTASFMKRKRGRSDFDVSEPEFLISCMDRHGDWAVIICLIGGGQEINTGEGGISEWIHALRSRFPHWLVHVSPRLGDAEYGSGEALHLLDEHTSVTYDEALHLNVSMRSYRAERVSDWVKQVLDLELEEASGTLSSLIGRYPVALTRDVSLAKRWLKARARGSERYGLMVSSQAQRLRPHAIDVRAPVDPVHWFLDSKDDVRSSYYLEDAATEFHVQGLEVDWAAIVWDADYRYTKRGWEHWSFVGDRWQRIKKPERQLYQKNAYRVLLTRARQGMVLVVPNGDVEDPTRDPTFYDETYAYLRSLGIPELD